VPTRTKLIVVDDGSVDGTGEILRRAAHTVPSLDVVTHSRNQGYGAALRSGVDLAVREGFDYVLFMDSDLTNSPSDIPRFYGEMLKGPDVIKATRYRRGGAMRGVPFWRQLVSRLGALVARTLFRTGMSDCTNGFRAVRTDILARLRLHETGFAIILEELYCCIFLAHRFVELPVLLTNRGTGFRPSSFSYEPAVLWSYLKYALLACFRVQPKGGRIQ